ncbi:MAG: L-dopachrome tautomerase-related protein [Phycisphaerae bacterium]|jgi:sugar lactone lactonase YvrE|nr:L-dopachrome tautomerase-related protein [Phycisphaerae bacterium]
MSIRSFKWKAVVAPAVLCVLLTGCKSGPIVLEPGRVALTEVAASTSQWTGVAISKEGRIFINYPRWSDSVPISVGEITPDGEIIPYPNKKWNAWTPSDPPGEHFVCVQSVYVDRDDFLWILDPGNPNFSGVVKGGPKLLKVDLKTDTIAQTIRFDRSIAPPKSYLNDIRVDTKLKTAYLSESGVGAIVVVDLKTGQARRMLDTHHSTASEDITLTIAGKEWIPGGVRPQVHCDGLALDAEGEYLYYQALTGRNLYRIKTKWLRDERLTEDQLIAQVEPVSASGASDAIMFGPHGNLYLSAIEDSAIRRLTPDRVLETVVADERLAWPDSFAIGPDGAIYVTTSRIHFGLGAEQTEPCRLFRLAPLR